MMASAGNPPAAPTSNRGQGRKVLIIVENLPVPFDRRVWQEATALKRHGYMVSIICPTGKGFEQPLARASSWPLEKAMREGM